MEPVDMPGSNGGASGNGAASGGAGAGTESEICQPDFKPCRDCQAATDQMQIELQTAGWFEAGQEAINLQREKCSDMENYCQNCLDIPAELLTREELPENTSQQNNNNNQQNVHQQHNNHQQQQQHNNNQGRNQSCDTIKVQHEVCISEADAIKARTKKAKGKAKKDQFRAQYALKISECEQHNERLQDCINA